LGGRCVGSHAREARLRLGLCRARLSHGKGHSGWQGQTGSVKLGAAVGGVERHSAHCPNSITNTLCTTPASSTSKAAAPRQRLTRRKATRARFFQSSKESSPLSFTLDAATGLRQRARPRTRRKRLEAARRLRRPAEGSIYRAWETPLWGSSRARRLQAIPESRLENRNRKSPAGKRTREKPVGKKRVSESGRENANASAAIER
jgi:hypothetical protein